MTRRVPIELATTPKWVKVAAGLCTVGYLVILGLMVAQLLKWLPRQGWLLPAMVLLLTAQPCFMWWVPKFYLRRAVRRKLQGRCPVCNYDRAGLSPEASCPECGRGLSGQQGRGRDSRGPG